MSGAGKRREGAGVARNAAFLVAGQIATAALSFGVTAMLARGLGARDYGVFYLAATLVQSAFVVADLGQAYWVVARIATDASAAGTLLGTGLVLRLLGGLATCPFLVALAAALHYPEATRTAISLTVVFMLLTSIGDGVSVILRGLERMDLEAALRVASKTVVGVAIGLAFVADGGLSGVLLAQIGGAAGALGVYWLGLRRVGMAAPRLSRRTASAILSGGAPFLLFAVVVSAQAAIDALLLSVLVPPGVIGWHAAAWKLAGFLVFPATVSSAALYPTLARLHAGRSPRYEELVVATLRAMILLAVPVAAGTYLFADRAVAFVYGTEAFTAAAGNLRVLAGYLLLVFIDITLGTAIMAANRQTRWIVAKVVSVLVAAGLSLVLIPRYQATAGNGALGCAAATVAAEAVMFVAALVLVPLRKRRLAVELAKDLGRGVAGTLPMGAAAWLLRGAHPLTGMGTAVVAYLASMYLLGAIRREDIRFVGDAVRVGSPV